MKYLNKETNADIIRTIIRRYIGKGIAFILLAAAILVFFYVYAYDYFADRLGEINGLLAIPLGVAIPFFLLKLHKDVFDKSWEGEITSIKSHEVKRGMHTSLLVAKDMQEYLTFTINLGYDMLILERPATELARFKKGDRLRHIRGTPYLQAIRRNSDTCDCVMCGAIVRESGDTCPHCHMSLVKFDPPRAWVKKEENK